MVADSQGFSHEQRIDADQPIESREQDLLGRWAFAEGIAGNVCDVPADRGFTVAIVGEWGSGKTSVLNMVQESLEAESRNIVVLRFNPWLFGGVHDLLIRFFGELGAQLGQRERVGIKGVLSAFAELGAVAAPLVPVPGVSLFASPLRNVAKWLRKPKSLLEQRNKLKKALSKLDCRIVVAIDDIDRLESDATRELIRLIRLTSDLPNLVFLLAFDWSHVADSLSRSGEEGSDYLDKIVQLRFDLPIPRQGDIDNLVFASLDHTLVAYQDAAFDRDAWATIFRDVIRPQMGNLRDAKRFLNAIAVVGEVVRKEVAFQDMVALEAVRMFAPEAFELIRSNRHLWVPGHSYSQQIAADLTRKDEIERVKEEAGEHKGTLEAALKNLFPVAQGMSPGTDVIGTWRAARRVACQEVFNIYLHAGMSEGEMGYLRMREILNAMSSRQDFAQTMASLDDDQLAVALDRLDDFRDEFPTEAASEAVPVLVDVMERVSDVALGTLGSLPRIRARWLLLRIFGQFKDETALAECVRNLLPHTERISAQAEIVGVVGHREGIGEGLLSQEVASSLEGTLIDNLLGATADDLALEWDLYPLLFRTWKWAEDPNKGQLETTIKGHLANPAFLLRLIHTAIASSTIDSALGRSVATRLDWAGLTALFGQELSVEIIEFANSPLYEELDSLSRRRMDLAIKYAKGENPGMMW